ncbi:MAG: PadR family transcriptional regulator [Clostridiales bacterium]|nr:PadR family transcriptional regulator [Clostridiales bacterium]
MNENMALTESTYYILLALAQPRHGYGVMQQTERMSGGRVRLAAGTLYGALNSLCECSCTVRKQATENKR